MNKSESIKELAGALCKAQGILRGALKDATNPHYKSKYADLASVWDAVRDPFSRNGLSIVQITLPSDANEIVLETILMHLSGEWISGTLSLPVSKSDAQGYGSAMTYARRYGLSGITGVAPEDDDGNAATKAAPKEAVHAANNRAKLTPENKEKWADAKAAYKRDGNLIAVLKRVDMSDEHQTQLIEEGME